MKVLFFARTRDLAGIEQIELKGIDNVSVRELRHLLGERYPKLASLLPHCAVAVDEDIAGDDRVIPRDATIALLPPVSGG